MTFSNGISNYNPGMPPVFPTPTPIRPDQSALRFLDIPDAIGPLMPWHATDSFASTLFFGDPVIYNPLNSDGFGEFQSRMFPDTVYEELLKLPVSQFDPNSPNNVATDRPAAPLPLIQPDLDVIKAIGVLGNNTLFPTLGNVGVDVLTPIISSEPTEIGMLPPTSTPKPANPLNAMSVDNGLSAIKADSLLNTEIRTVLPIVDRNGMVYQNGFSVMNGFGPMNGMPFQSQFQANNGINGFLKPNGFTPDSLPSLSLSFSPDLATPEINYSFVEPGTSEYMPTPAQSSG